jgi:NAD(P)H-nitrite reductase large subunit
MVRPAKHAVIVGGGFIGLEMAENLVERGFEVTVVELADQVLAPLDLEYGRLVADFLEHHGVHVVPDDGVAGFEQSENETLIVTTQSGKRYPADIVMLALGVRPPARRERRIMVQALLAAIQADVAEAAELLGAGRANWRVVVSRSAFRPDADEGVLCGWESLW